MWLNAVRRHFCRGEIILRIEPFRAEMLHIGTAVCV